MALNLDAIPNPLRSIVTDLAESGEFTNEEIASLVETMSVLTEDPIANYMNADKTGWVDNRYDITITARTTWKSAPDSPNILDPEADRAAVEEFLRLYLEEHGFFALGENSEIVVNVTATLLP